MLHATDSMAKPKPVIRILSYKRESDLAFRWYGQQHTFVPEYMPKKKKGKQVESCFYSHQSWTCATFVRLMQKAIICKKAHFSFPIFPSLFFFCHNSYWTALCLTSQPCSTAWMGVSETMYVGMTIQWVNDDEDKVNNYELRWIKMK